VHYVYLTLAILTETIGTSAIQASRQFTRLGPSLVVVIGYAASFYFMALTLRVLPIGIVYAVWSGVGIVLIAAIGAVVYGQSLDLPALIGIALIIAGIIFIYLFSSTTTY